MLVHGYLYLKAPVTTTTNKSLQEYEKKYPFLSKRILQDFPNDILIKFSPLRKDLRSIVEPWGSQFAFFFEYLPTGVTIGVNEKDEFSAASLLKVPVVMAYYLQQETEGKSHDSEAVILTKKMLHVDYGSLWKRGEGAKVTLGEAVEYALKESDNTAVEVIISKTNYKYFQEVYDGLDVDSKEVREIPVITLKNYSSILKALFFASVVNKEHSEKILSLLTESIYKDKLPSGVSENIKVAHKIGVADNQLYTDCGIVYVPRRPYLLCLFSVSDENMARDRMEKISKTVYDFVSTAK
jgi:beta-lactamase class A